MSEEIKPVKPCRKCGAMDRNNQGGCRPCAKSHMAKYHAKRLAENPEYSRENYAKLLARNPNYYRIIYAKQLAKNPNFLREIYVKRLARNPDLNREIYAKRKARKSANSGSPWSIKAGRIVFQQGADRFAGELATIITQLTK